MRHGSIVAIRLGLFILLAFLSLLSTGIGPASSAQTTVQTSKPAVFSGARSIAEASAPIAVFVELTDEPTTRLFAHARQRTSAAQATRAAQDQLRRVEAAQRALLAADLLAEAPLLFRTQRVLNGIAVLVDEADVAQIEAMSGVASVHALPTHSVALRRSVPLLGAPQVWDRVYPDGLTGESVRIGIVDTGIDYLHTHFGGPGTGYAANDTDVITDVVAGIQFPTARVAGGYDFAGDAYDARPTGNFVPTPDPDPMDCWGHGTHVAGIAAGSGVLPDGRTYTGPYTSDLDFAQFSIGPGVAPRARLYALKIFGCAGVSQLTTAAIEWAVDPDGDGDFSDRLDVLNLSIGSPFGSAADPTTKALENAALTGMIVVAAAGNSGDTFFVTAAPGVARSAISVASAVTVDPAQDPTIASAGAPHPAESVSDFSARGPRRQDAAVKPDIAAPGSNIRSASAGSGHGGHTSSGTSMATPHVAGAAALLRQRHPDWTAEEIKALLINTAHDALLARAEAPPIYYAPTRGGAGRLDLLAADGTDLVAFNADVPGEVSISFGMPTVVDRYDALHNVRLINHGSTTRTLFLRYVPVVDLPGADVTLLDADRVTLAPQERRTVSLHFAAQGDALRHLPDPTLAARNLFPRHYLSEEMGHLTIWPDPARFSAPVADGSIQGDVTIQVQPEDNAWHYTVALSNTTAITVTSADLVYANGPTLRALLAEAAAGTTITATGVLTADRSLQRWLASGLLSVALTIEDGSSARASRTSLAAIDPVLRVPVYAAPRAASAMRAGVSPFSLDTAEPVTLTVPLVGEGVLTAGSLAASHFPTDVVSVVSAFELQYSSPNEGESKGIFDHADLRYVGVSIAGQQPPPAVGDPIRGSRILFGIATYGEWSTPSEITVKVHIDTDEDGESDYVLRTDNAGSFLGRGASDEFLVVLEDVRSEEEIVSHLLNVVSAAELHTSIFGSNVMILAVDAADLDLSSWNSDFRYVVGTYSMDTPNGNGLIDFARPQSYDVARPGLTISGESMGDLPVFADLPATALTVTADRQALRANGSTGLLLLHHHNVHPLRAEAIPIRLRWRLYAPLVSKGR